MYITFMGHANMRNMQIRFNGGPKDGCVLVKPINSNLDSVLALYAQAPVGRYEVVTRSPGGQHIIVAWKESAPPAFELPEMTIMGSTNPLELANTFERLAKILRGRHCRISAGGMYIQDLGNGGTVNALDITSDLRIEIGGVRHGN